MPEKLLSPEAEVTRSLSSNLLKYNFTYVNGDEKRVIDTNELAAKKIEVLASRQSAASDEDAGFAGGLDAERIEELFADADGEGGQSGSNLMKAMPEVPAGPTPEELLAEAQQKITAMQDAAKAELEQERQRVLAEARETGYAEGSRKAAGEYRTKQQELENYRASLEEEYRKNIDELEPKFIDTLTGIYEHLFHVELENYRDILVYLIHSAMRKAEGARDFIVHVSGDDYPYVSMQKKQLLTGLSAPGAAVEVIEDALLGKNECTIETNAGIFDCGLETELTELTKKLKLLSYERTPGEE